MTVALRPYSCLLAVVAVSASAAEPEKITVDEGSRLFATQVWPIFNDKCLACHGADESKVKGDFRLTGRESLLKGGESGESGITIEHPDESLLLRAVRWEDYEMPPKENDRLSPAQIKAIHRWIELGATWPDDETVKRISAEQDKWQSDVGVTVKTSGGLSDDWSSRRYDPSSLWAYQALAKPTVPAVAGPIATPIDAFVNASLQKAGLDPGPAADRRTLLRRVTFDLTGLPPTPAETEAFITDPADDDIAFARVVDRLLASPHYGEKWGRHWLDVVRYADSSGFANDYERGNAWRYRDYVVRSFNADKPYSQFIREQLAGDELAPDDPELLVAAGFLRMGPWELTGMEVPKVARQRFLDDVTDVVGQTFLSHPLQCAKCHDHKFDPVPTRDYYSMQAVFATTQLTERSADFLQVENQSGFEERQYLEARKRRYEAELKRIREKEADAARQWCEERGLEVVSRNEGLKRGLPEAQIPPKGVGLEPVDFGLERIARKGLERLTWEFDRYKPFALSVYNGHSIERKSVLNPIRVPDKPLAIGVLEETAILAGGDPFSPTEPVSPGTLSALNSLCSDSLPSYVLPDSIAGRRTALADWITHSENALAARSIVNRIWLWHFRKGIVGSANNFGATGDKPTHPELLDWLAATFLESGGSIKHLHRTMLLSETYRRASQHPHRDELREKDPLGKLYAVFPPRRLTAEEIRDAMLLVSGELNPELGGIPVRPEINPEAAFQPRQVMGTFAAAWVPSPLPSDRHRRSLYALQLRGLRDPMMETFNQPGPDTPCEARETSTVTPQVFALFNGLPSYSRALAVANRVRRTSQDRETAIESAFLYSLNRLPTTSELTACLSHWEASLDDHTQAVDFPSPPEEIVREAVEENTGEKFTFTELLDAAANFVTDLQPSEVDAETRALADICLALLNTNEFLFLD